jgi:hypothetical protein
VARRQVARSRNRCAKRSPEFRLCRAKDPLCRRSSINTGEAYVGTDEAPTAAQIVHAKSNAGGANPVIIPVAQTSIAVVANLPAGCSITGGITWKDLSKIFAGTIVKWSELETDNGGCGTNSIVRVVREDGSGTTFQFKNYLSILEPMNAAGQIETGVLTPGVAPACTSKTWAQIRNNGGTPNLNLSWPENRHKTSVGGKEVEVGCSTPGSQSPIVRANTGT